MNPSSSVSSRVPLALSHPDVLSNSDSTRARKLGKQRFMTPGSPTDQMLSPCSMKLVRKTSGGQLPAHGRIFSLEKDVPRKICPLSPEIALVVGSSSTSRKKILDLLQWKYSTISPDIDEKAIRSDDFLELPILIATAKAQAVLDKMQQGGKMSEDSFVLLTFDQVALYKGRLRDKPVDAEEAREFLSSYSKDSVSTVSAVVATHWPSGRRYAEVDIATVTWKEIPERVIDAVMQEGEVLTCCGGFMVEHPLLNACIDSIDGTMDSVLGMPVSTTCRAILKVIDDEED